MMTPAFSADLSENFAVLPQQLFLLRGRGLKSLASAKAEALSC